MQAKELSSSISETFLYGFLISPHPAHMSKKGYVKWALKHKSHPEEKKHLPIVSKPYTNSMIYISLTAIGSPSNLQLGPDFNKQLPYLEDMAFEHDSVYWRLIYSLLVIILQCNKLFL